MMIAMRGAFRVLVLCASLFASTAWAQAGNYQGLWWASPASLESGWGINFTHQRSPRSLNNVLGDVIGSAALNISGATLRSIAVGPVLPAIAIGQTAPLSASGTYSDGTSGPLTSGVTWTTSNSVVASVSSSGIVTAVSVGTATVTASVAGVNSSTTVTVPSATLRSNEFSAAKMIPLRDHIYRAYHFALSLRGSSILGSQPYEASFDTGSIATAIPYGCLDKTKLIVLAANVIDQFGVLSDLVRGQLAALSQDGLTTYAVDDYAFFARRRSDGSEAPCDRTPIYGNAMTGAFPGAYTFVQGTITVEIVSFPYALAKKYANGQATGFGIATRSALVDIKNNWASTKSYLLLWRDPNIISALQWRTDAHDILRSADPTFWPSYVPGFSMRFSFPLNSAGQRVPDIVVPNLMATIDTGAPELAVRLGSENPHRSATYREFFSGVCPDWMLGQFKADSLCPVAGVNVQVEFASSSGSSARYTYLSSPIFGQGLQGSTPPLTVIAGDWNGVSPFVIGLSPINRINLGNAVYFFFPIYFYDITNKRVGVFPVVNPSGVFPLIPISMLLL